MLLSDSYDTWRKSITIQYMEAEYNASRMGISRRGNLKRLLIWFKSDKHYFFTVNENFYHAD